MIAFLLIVQATAGLVIPNSLPVGPAVSAYADCSRAGARQLEPSGEAAPVVADVVVNKCEPLLDPAYNETIAAFRNSPTIKAYEATGHVYLDYRQAKPGMLQTMRSTIRSLALDLVVQLRAEKAAKK